MTWIWTDQLAQHLPSIDSDFTDRLSRLIEHPIAVRIPEDADGASVVQLLGLAPKAPSASDTPPTMTAGEHCPCGDWTQAGAASREETVVAI